MGIKKDLDNLRVGHALEILGDIYVVEDKGVYDEDGWKWPELKLKNLNTDETHYLEWELDDELEIYLSTEKVDVEKIGLNNKEDGLSKVKSFNKIELDGVKFKYDDDYTATWDGKHKVRFFDFYSKKTDQTLAVEYWYEGKDKSKGFKVEGYLCHQVRPVSIEIIGEFDNPLD
jgi:hypothetical protein